MNINGILNALHRISAAPTASVEGIEGQQIPGMLGRHSWTGRVQSSLLGLQVRDEEDCHDGSRLRLMQNQERFEMLHAIERRRKDTIMSHGFRASRGGEVKGHAHVGVVPFREDGTPLLQRLGERVVRALHYTESVEY